jgi:hypothetical protein
MAQKTLRFCFSKNQDATVTKRKPFYGIEKWLIRFVFTFGVQPKASVQKRKVKCLELKQIKREDPKMTPAYRHSP